MLAISEEENETLCYEKIDQVGSFTYLGRILSKTLGAVKILKVE